MKNIMSFKLFESYLPPIEDEEIIAATLIGEAGGEEDESSMIAVLRVLENRAKIKGTSAAGEAIRPLQFSMWNNVTSGISKKNDYSKEKIKEIIEKYKKHKKWKEAIILSKTTKEDITKGATHYYAPKIVSKIPSWANEWQETVTIGGHKFGKNVKF
jgi:hypothetical protein